MGGARLCGENLPPVEVEGSLRLSELPWASQLFPHSLQSLANRLLDKQNISSA